VDEQTKPTFESRGLKPFTIFHQGRTMELTYHEAPEEALTSSIKMKSWALMAMKAAERALAAKKPKKRK
jgi:TfoX/Sxy family transcriptional regulator of competence genes